MSIVKVTRSDVETTTLVTTPSRSYTSSSLGVTGSVGVFSRLSKVERNKDAYKLYGYLQYDDAFSNVRNFAASGRLQKPYNIYSLLSGAFFQGKPVNANDPSDNILYKFTDLKSQTAVQIERIVPTPYLSRYSLSKNNVKDMLMPHYRVEYPHAHWAYTNYNSLNFFTSYNGSTQMVPTSSVLLYPNVVRTEDRAVINVQDGYVSGTYCLTGGFSFDFYINPRYNQDGLEPGHFKAGTIFHLSSSYALSLVTGTLKDKNGLPDGFRIQLQLSHSADYPPSTVLPGAYPKNLVFLSDDNSLRYNNWHHVIVRWGTNIINNGTGSFIVDGVRRGDFVVPSGTISPRIFKKGPNFFDPAVGQPDMLCVGNYYEGQNKGNDRQSYFFNTDARQKHGVSEILLNNYSGLGSYSFNHPLKAEVHDLSIRRYFVSDAEIAATGSRGAGSAAFNFKNYAFYLPPFFVEDVPHRAYTVVQTPLFSADGTTTEPFSIPMAFNANGHYVNLENYVKDFSNSIFPRLMNLTASYPYYAPRTSLSTTKDANELIAQDSNIVKRNLTVLPCDDGNFDPNYEILTGERLKSKYVDSTGCVDYSYVSLENMCFPGSTGTFGDAVKDSAFELANVGPTPEYPLNAAANNSAYNTFLGQVNNLFNVGSSAFINRLFSYPSDKDILIRKLRTVPLVILNRLRDFSSNQVTIFNISNIYYGKRILPGSFTITDSSLSGSHGSVGITLKDDGRGNLYRADSLTKHYTQSTVGNIFYDEGIVLVKNPHLYFFGKDKYQLSFKGVYDVISSKYEILANRGLLNSSSNSTAARNGDNTRPSGDPIDNETFVYINTVNFHDENLNVVAKAKLAQPVIKREGDKILFKVAFDF